MLQDARKLREGTLVRSDVCVVGAGAAGIPLARALAGAGLDVCVLESGGLAPDPATRDLSRGSSVGQPYPGLETTRSRFFGGSTNCWAGFCRPLDGIDFEVREWLPWSGWPFGRRELDPYYEKAQQALGLGAFDYRPTRWGAPEEPGGIDPEDARVFQFGSGPIRMAATERAALEASERIRVLLHANVTEILLAEDGGSVAELRVRCLSGPGLRARARRYVLATGGIENARLLLASRSVRPAGVGNANDLVGRFFMEHPHLRSHALLLSHAPGRLRFFDLRKQEGQQVRGILAPAEAWLRREETLNVGIQLWRDPQPPADAWRRALAAASAESDGRVLENAALHHMVFHCEQAPNPESRVTLSGDVDALGVPRARLDWRLQPVDKRSALRAHEWVASALGAAGVGRVRVLLGEALDRWPRDMTGGNHHMGTTRMHADPKQGVVDPDGRVHGVPNLFVAGSSVFPTGGAANPTLTLVALVYRLAERLRGELA